MTTGQALDDDDPYGETLPEDDEDGESCGQPLTIQRDWSGWIEFLADETTEKSLEWREGGQGLWDVTEVEPVIIFTMA